MAASPQRRQRQRVFTRLEVKQGVGSLSIVQTDECLILQSMHPIVAHCNDMKNALSIYGLAHARSVSHGGEQFTEYINNSVKTSRCEGDKKQIFENYISREKFTSPNTTLILTNTRLNLTTIVLDGCVSLNNINSDCIDSECGNGRKILTLSLHKTAALRCPLAASVINVKMYDETVVSGYQMIEDRRGMWSVHNAIFDVDNCRRIEGISVVNALTIKAPTQRMISAAITRSPTCSYKSTPSSLILLEDELAPRPSMPTAASSHSPFSTSLLGVVSGDDFLDSILSFVMPRRRVRDPLQGVLDMSRREYEADTTPMPKIPEKQQTPVGGNVNAVAEPTASKEDRCSVCMENRASVAFSCGHVPVCPECVDDYRAHCATCPLCREPILHITKLYL